MRVNKQPVIIDQYTNVELIPGMSSGERVVGHLLQQKVIKGEIENLTYNQTLPNKLTYEKFYYNETKVRAHEVYVDFMWTDVSSGKTIACEYNGYQHLGTSSKYCRTALELFNQKSRDIALNKYCIMQNIPLITVQVPVNHVRGTEKVNNSLTETLLDKLIARSIKKGFELYGGPLK